VSYDFSDARIRTTVQMPYMSAHVMSLHIIETPGMKTMGVDKYMRLYYDPEVFDLWDIDECAGVILHEDLHVLLRHWQRFEHLVGPNPKYWQVQLWNIAADLTVNQILRETKYKGFKSGKEKVVKLPKDSLFPELYKFPLNLTTETYYEMLQEQMADQIDQMTGNISEMMQPQNGMGGSGADGQKRGWEVGPPDPTKKDSVPGMSDLDQHMLEQAVAKAVDEHKSKGNIPAGMQVFADGILRPRIDPKKELLSVVRRALNVSSGAFDYSYKKIARRNPNKQGFVLPGLISYTPNIVVIADTSGSMSGKDLALCLGLIKEVLRVVNKNSVKIISGDTHIETIQKVYQAEQVELRGGGGTSMANITEEAYQLKPQPDLIIICTDGYTDWPRQDWPVVVACLTQEASDYAVPDWIKKVVMKP
jgi:predicted metal-dependent peptidase